MNPLAFQLAAALLPFGSYITLPPLDLHASDFTVATFVYLDETFERNIVLGNWSSQDHAWQLLYAINAGGQTAINLRRDMQTDGSDPAQDLVALVGHTALTDNQWHHIAVTFRWGANGHAPRAVLYVDGQEDGEAAPQPRPDPRVRNPYQLKPSPNAYLIGRKEDSLSSDSWFSGQLCNFHIYTQALSAQRIREEIDSAQGQPAPCALQSPVRTHPVQLHREYPQLPEPLELRY